MVGTIIILAHAFVGWALCGGIMGVGRRITSMENTLKLHAIGAPIIFGIISLVYFNRFGFTTPLQTAIIFVSFIIFMDAFLIAPFIEKSYDMFRSPIGTWIPFLLIFISTYVTGSYFA